MSFEFLPGPGRIWPCFLVLALVGCAAAPPPRNLPAAQLLPPPKPAAAPGPMIWPKLLSPGDTIAFVAPAGELDRERIARAQERLEARGYKVRMRDDVFEREGYLAGSDKRRAEELMAAFLDPEVDAIFAGTGGYGTMRILDRLDYSKIRANPKILVGFSDLTGLHSAINSHAGLVTFHGPMAMGVGSEQGLSPFTEEYFYRALETPPGPAGYPILVPAPIQPVLEQSTQPDLAVPRPSGLVKGKARGRLVGGNLSLISALEGTPFAIDTEGAILLIEDVREAPYRIDRMLRQLQLSGKIAKLRGAVLAQFTRNYDREDEARVADPRYEVDGVLRQYFENAGIPVLINFPLGHHTNNATLPLGAEVEIDADSATLRVLGPRPVEADLVDLAAAIPGLRVELKYAGTDNFLGAVVDGYGGKPRALLARPAAEALGQVQRQLSPFGLGLLVYDAYRPQRAVDHFVRWAKDLEDQSRKSVQYPRVDKAKLFELGYIAARSGHTRGSTVDLTLCRLEDGQRLDMGSAYDLFDEISWPSSDAVPAEARANRLLLRSLMLQNGFRPLKEEWWHFTLEGEPYPETYFDVPLD
jgi:muramoyltetrapeptide carboxypeptidase